MKARKACKKLEARKVGKKRNARKARKKDRQVRSKGTKARRHVRYMST